MQLLVGFALSMTLVAPPPSGRLVPPLNRLAPRAAASGSTSAVATTSTVQAAAQDAAGSNGASSTLSVHGVGERPVELSLASLRALPRTKVTTEERGKTLTYEGVLMADVLKRAGMDSGHGHGRSLNLFVVATARDGYHVVFSMGEIDPNLSASQIVIADQMDGQPLGDGVGPLRIVAPRDLHGSRGVRALVRLDVRTIEH